MISFIRDASFPGLEKLGRLVHGTFQKERAASTAMKRNMGNPILNKRDACIDINGPEEGRVRYISLSNLYLGNVKG